MEALLYIGSAIAAYLTAGWNPAIAFSMAFYNKDIRTCGSGNPGFTNFKRTFGNKWAWAVLMLDLSKAAVVVGIFACLFEKHYGCYQFGAAYTGAFAMLGHAYPIWYKFKGGKGFLVCLSTIWIIDPKAGLIATAIMIILLLLTKYMSLATISAMLTCPILLFAFGASWSVIILCSLSVLFMTARHKGNIKRLIKGTESKFVIKSNS